MKPQPKTKKSLLRRLLKGALIGVVGLLTVLFLFSRFERWRGHKVWTEAEARLNAAGIRTQWAEVIPSPIPVDQNLALARVFTGCYRANGRWTDIGNWEAKPIFGDQADQDAQKAHKLYAPDKKAKIGQLFGLHASENDSSLSFDEVHAERLTELATLIEPYRPLFAELREECAKRPDSYFPGDYSRATGSPIPSFNFLRPLTRLMTAEAILAFQDGNPSLALENCLAISRAGDLNPQVDFLVNTMMETVMVRSYICEILWYGLQEDLFDPAQLGQISAWAAQTDLIAKLGRSFQYELLMGIDSTRQFTESPVETSDLFGAMGTPMFIGSDAIYLEDWLTRAAWYFTPAEGWNWLMLTRQVNFMGEFLDGYNPENGTIDQAKLQASQERYDEIEARDSFFDGLLLMMVSAFQKVTETTLDAQRKIDLIGITATLALQAKQVQVLPEALTESATDPESQQPYGYELVENGFTLTAIGQDSLPNTEDDLVIHWHP